MRKTHIMYEHLITCKREMMCWFNTISSVFEVKKDLGDNTFQVFFISTMSRNEIESKFGISLGWVSPDDH